MPDLALERATYGGEHYEILDEARNVVGHIMLSERSACRDAVDLDNRRWSPSRA
jgi:hypothetical protein